MGSSAVLAIVLLGATPLGAQAGPWGGRPHPAVVRIIAPEKGGVSFGSGALIAVNQQHGLVVTNWHVVRDATGQIAVVFPDGFRSGATVLKTDPDWDLAALAVWRPDVEPIPLATEAPRPSEPLRIAGYGTGRYREITGRCTQYVSPGSNQPYEMVELSGAARQGDSGGPIFNSRGELAGVLFGATFGSTIGSYCGRVRSFLASVTDEFREGSPTAPMIASRTPPEMPVTDGPGRSAREEPTDRRPPDRSVTASIAVRPAPSVEPSPSQPKVPASDRGWTASAGGPDAGQPPVGNETSDTIATVGTSRIDQIKNILAVIGLVAVLFHGLRLLSLVSES